VPSIEPFPEKLRRAHTLPSGAFDGMMALICAALANTGIGCTDVVPCVIFTKHHPAWVASGNESEGREPGLRIPRHENYHSELKKIIVPR
jgi:hypothetical protein